MSYYHDDKNVEHYIQMAEGYDGQILIDVLKNYLPDESTVLELGIGPGKDLLLLSEHYQITGSDYSPKFVERFQKAHPTIEVFQLDAVTMQTDKTFDGIYSNKVLYHLSPDDLKQSLENQAKVLRANGIAIHSFWYGDEDYEQHGLRFVYHTEESLKQLISDDYDLMEIKRYTEMETDDSFYVVLRRK